MYLTKGLSNFCALTVCLLAGKARRLKQAKEEAQQEIEKFKQEREIAHKDYEARVSHKYELHNETMHIVRTMRLGMNYACTEYELMYIV